jgi:hypothetical protein
VKKFFLAPNFAIYLQNMPFPQQKIVIKIEERENPRKMIFVHFPSWRLKCITNRPANMDLHSPIPPPPSTIKRKKNSIYGNPRLLFFLFRLFLDTVVCAPDDGWRYHPKHVEQFPDKINCVTLHLVGYILEYSYDARTHER